MFADTYGLCLEAEETHTRKCRVAKSIQPDTYRITTFSLSKQKRRFLAFNKTFPFFCH